jgi:hypothetical protein
MKPLLILLWIGCCTNLCAQNLRPLLAGKSMPFTNDGQQIKGSGIETSGNPFFTEVWYNTNLQLAGGDIFRNVKTRLDILNNNLHFIDEKGAEMYVSAIELKRVEFTDSVKKDSVLLKFNVYAEQKSGQKKTAFYQVLEEGRITLLNLVAKRIDENRDNFTQRITREIVLSETGYVYSNNTLVAIKHKSSFWKELMQDKWTTVENHINANDIGFKSHDDIQKIVVFYNALF